MIGRGLLRKLAGMGNLKPKGQKSIPYGLLLGEKFPGKFGPRDYWREGLKKVFLKEGLIKVWRAKTVGPGLRSLGGY